MDWRYCCSSPISKVDIASFVDPHIVIVGRNAFFAFSNVWNEKGIKKWGKMWKVETFTSERGFEFTKDA